MYEIGNTENFPLNLPKLFSCRFYDFTALHGVVSPILRVEKKPYSVAELYEIVELLHFVDIMTHAHILSLSYLR